jgi:hypothetical protein
MLRKILTVVLAAALPLSGNALAAGALAIDSNQGNQYGWAVDFPNMGQAEQRALRECGSGCRIVMRVNAGCGAYATDQQRGSTIYGWGTDSSGGAAQNRALAECRNRGGSACIVRVWGCNKK